jgi:hypothetical protein
VIEEVRRVAEIKDNAARVKAAAALMTELQAGVMETARIRREGIKRLRDSGASLADVGKLLGVSRARIAQLKDAGPPSERAFLASERLRIAMPEQPGGVVARAHAATGQRLMTLALGLGLAGELEYVLPSGDIDLDRDDLVIVTGLQPPAQLAALLRADPRLNLGQPADDRWAITERDNGNVHATAEEDPANRPLAYLGRLPNPSGEGSLLVIASTQPIGAYGAAHYLAEHLAELYDTVERRHFSMIIASTRDPDTDEVTSSQALTAPLLHREKDPA